MEDDQDDQDDQDDDKISFLNKYFFNLDTY